MITCTYRILRYVPNLLRDEWINVGVLFHDRAARRLDFRAIEDASEFARLHRLHPEADLALLRALPAEISSQLAALGGHPEALLARFDDTLSNALQLGPQKAVLTDNPAAELERVYHAQVRPPDVRRISREAGPGSRGAIHALALREFQSKGLLARLERGVRMAEFTFAGDTMRIDFAYRRNGTRGFVQALPLLRDAAQVKSLAFTAESIRARAAAEFHAVTENAPAGADGRYAETAAFLRQQKIEVTPVAALPELAARLRELMGA